MLCHEYLSELGRVVFELVERRLVVVEVLPNGLDQLQVPLVEVVGHQVSGARHLGGSGDTRATQSAMFSWRHEHRRTDENRVCSGREVVSRVDRGRRGLHHVAVQGDPGEARGRFRGGDPQAGWRWGHDGGRC